jgi:hypothetical protein
VARLSPVRTKEEHHFSTRSQAIESIRRQAVESARSHNRIAGIPEDREATPIFQAFIDGEIGINEMGRHIDAMGAARESPLEARAKRLRA